MTTIEPEMLLSTEPESGFFQRFYDVLIAAFVPEMRL